MRFEIGQRIIDKIRGKNLDISKSTKELLNKDNLKKWFNVNGDKTLRLDYDLNESSLVFDVGGYEGNFSSDIFLKYGCRIHIFEPMDEFIEIIKSKYGKNSRIIINPFGLSNKNDILPISCDKDGSSFFCENSLIEKKEAKLVDINDYLQKNNINHVDLIKINIEGGEYDLLERLIECNQVETFDNIQVQFHNVDENSKSRMESIQKALSKTHRLTYQYLMVWENWVKK